jgi:hypothetical protein
VAGTSGQLAVVGQSLAGFRASGTFIVDCCELNVCGDVYPPEEDPFWQGVDYSVNANPAGAIA